MNRNTRLSIFVLAAIASACSVFLGGGYERQKAVPGTMGVVYIYSGDIDATQRTYIDRDPSTAGTDHALMMVEKGYFPYLVAAGPIRIINDAGEPDACIEFQVEAQTHYFVRVDGAKAESNRIVVMESSEGEAEISTRRQMATRSKTKSNKTFDVECPTVLARGLY